MNWAGGSGRAESSSSRGNSDAAPVTQFATSSESMSEWLLARSDQYVVAIRSPLGQDDPLVAVHELGVTDLAYERLELVGVPDVVLIGERDITRAGRNPLQRALEVVVEAAPPVRA